MKPTIAIIGTGISAMGAAYFLKDKFDIIFYEKNNYAGGHTNTLTIEEEGIPIYIDSAFMVYNEITYPNLTRLFKELDVKIKDTDMSFSVQHKPTNLEYCGTGINGLFAQRKNILNISHWKLLLEINRFNKESLEVLEDNQYREYSLKYYIKEKKYSSDFLNKFLIPISSAVWSTPPSLMLDFPAQTLVQFFKNHGFLGLKGHYQWKTVVEGSQRYREKIMRYFKGKVLLNTPVVKIKREEKCVAIKDGQGKQRKYDKVIIAAHADEALKMLDTATEDEKNILSQFPYQENSITLHTDESVMPKSKLAWSSWNYRIDNNSPSTIYWMNNLQHVSDRRNYFISVNDTGIIDESNILWRTTYAHPLFNVRGIQVQERLPDLNKNGLVYFCGAYFKYGFHEDGLTSGINVARKILGDDVWT